jgi:hypothetical protein
MIPPSISPRDGWSKNSLSSLVVDGVFVACDVHHCQDHVNLAVAVYCCSLASKAFDNVFDTGVECTLYIGTVPM